MITDNMTKEERIEYWELVMEDFQQTDLTKTAYCQENDLSVSTFNYWENRLKDLHAEELLDGNRFVELIPPGSDDAESNSRFARDKGSVPERATSAGFEPELTIQCNDLQIMVNSSTPLPLLRQILREARHAM